jgi:preprotein translocase subunit SecD
MNRYPAWVNWLVLVVVVAGCIIALPNLYGDDPAVYIARDNGQPVAESLLPEVRASLEDAGIDFSAVEIDDDAAIVRFADVTEQLRGSDLLREELTDHTVALTLAPRVPVWLAWLGLEPMSLGLDLRGGVHFVYQVDLDAAIEQLLENYEETLRTEFRDAEIRARQNLVDGNTLVVTLQGNDPDQADEAEEIINDLDRTAVLSSTPRLIVDRDQVDGQTQFRVQLGEALLRERQDFAIEQNTTTLRNRVNEIGVAEPVVQRQGLDQILVQLPGIQDPAQAEDVLGATATLEYRAVDHENDAYQAESRGRPPIGSELYEDEDGNPILLKTAPITTGEHVIDATPGFDQYSSPVVNVVLDGPGGDAMFRFTRDNVQRNMAVVFIEQKPQTVIRNGEETIETITEERVISNATIQGVFSNRFQTSGLTQFEARNLALLLRAGALATPIVKIEERTIGPSLGADNIAKGRLAIIVGFALVVVFMAIYYRVFGLVANMALLANLILIIAMLSLLPTALTLPGIAGIVLTVGMAVDANVLIFERIREELRNGNSPQASIRAGYEKAFSTIADANITTLIAAIVLYAFGTGPIRGFAVTLMIGIVTSMFTAIVGTRVVVNLIYGRRKNLKGLSIGGGLGNAAH